jgi:hypothetical protein
METSSSESKDSSISQELWDNTLSYLSSDEFPATSSCTETNPFEDSDNQPGQKHRLSSDDFVESAQRFEIMRQEIDRDNAPPRKEPPKHHPLKPFNPNGDGCAFCPECNVFMGWKPNTLRCGRQLCKYPNHWHEYERAVEQEDICYYKNIIEMHSKVFFTGEPLLLNPLGVPRVKSIYMKRTDAPGWIIKWGVTFSN